MGEYIHYGHSEFSLESFKRIKNREMFTKPFGGLWACKHDYDFGWKEWCERENFESDFSKSFEFDLKTSARVLRIHHVSDLVGLPRVGNSFPGFLTYICLDFEELATQYDAIEVLISNYNLYYLLYGWDCDSILILNEDALILKESEN